ncbi:hypothetical protein RBSWK_01193 [Rhodopirellula baltica SWK14]|uniref:Uncharacterized protein n=1 Tax=Rhodopirellula baltica SWK14 TaxID=993516 RepID=L7CM30_RHOBT|nr:hypothetical protein RBSWK_01193 [Rhodopirellula baltica SWK14]
MAITRNLASLQNRMVKLASFQLSRKTCHRIPCPHGPNSRHQGSRKNFECRDIERVDINTYIRVSKLVSGSHWA